LIIQLLQAQKAVGVVDVAVTLVVAAMCATLQPQLVMPVVITERISAKRHTYLFVL